MLLNLTILSILIFSVILVFGARLMFEAKYSHLLVSILIICVTFSSIIRDYKIEDVGVSDILILIIGFSILIYIFIWGYKRNKDIYSIHNVKHEDVINIIEDYLQRKNINYEVKNEEIHLLEIKKSISIGGKIETNLDCSEINNEDFYEEFIGEVRSGIKKVKQRYFPYEGLFYICFAVFLFLLKYIFLK